MSLTLLFSKKIGGKIGDLQLDATLSEVHDYTNEVTEYPVEDGSTISDYIRKLPATLQMEGFVTNSPITLIQERIAEFVGKKGTTFEPKNLKREEVKNNVEFARDVLLAITGRKINGLDIAPQLVTVVTGLRVYKNMALRNLRIPRDNKTGDALKFTCELVEVKKVNTETVAIPNSAEADVDRNQSTVDRGKQTPSESNEEVTERTSLLKSIFNSAVR